MENALALGLWAWFEPCTGQVLEEVCLVTPEAARFRRRQRRDSPAGAAASRRNSKRSSESPSTGKRTQKRNVSLKELQALRAALSSEAYAVGDVAGIQAERAEPRKG